MELKMPAEDENSTMNGTRGASVAVTPGSKKNIMPVLQAMQVTISCI